MSQNISRDDAWRLVCQHTQSESLQKHMLGVEAAMLHYAGLLGENPETYAVAGLLHDFDYEQHPWETGTRNGHPFWGVEFLRQCGVAENILDAILGHANYSNTPRITKISRTLFAVDELSGFVTAATLVRPDKNIGNLEMTSVKKKLKDKAFAKGVNRQDIAVGLTEMQEIVADLTLETHIENVIAGMRARADVLGLTGI